MTDFCFQSGFFRFFEDLAAHNDRDWFEGHRERYRQEVQTPLAAFVTAMAPRLQAISPHFNANPKPNGGTIFRLHRDTRFSKDKRPYKTHAACHFRHKSGNDVHGPGFYFHLEPGSMMVGTGVWLPDATAIRAIRERIVDKPEEWRDLKDLPGMTARLDARFEDHEDARLKNPPRGFPKEHVHVEDLKRKSFIAMARYPEEMACAPEMLDTVSRFYEETAPLAAFLAKAVGVPF